MHANVHSNIIYNRQDTEATYTHTGILLSHKKERNLAIAATWMDVGSIMLRSQTEKDKYCKKKKSNKLVNITKRSRLRDLKNKLVVTSGEREGGGVI